jgi:hypothetical protein
MTATCMHCAWPTPEPTSEQHIAAMTQLAARLDTRIVEDFPSSNKLNCTLSKKACAGPADCPFEFPTHMDFCGKCTTLFNGCMMDIGQATHLARELLHLLVLSCCNTIMAPIGAVFGPCFVCVSNPRGRAKQAAFRLSCTPAVQWTRGRQTLGHSVK